MVFPIPNLQLAELLYRTDVYDKYGTSSLT